MAGHFRVWSILLHFPERSMTSKVNVYDESFFFFRRPHVQEAPGSRRGAASSQPLLVWTTVCSAALLAELVASYSPSMDRISPTCKHGWLPLLAPCWQRLCGPASLSGVSTNLGTGYTVKTYGHSARTAAFDLSQWCCSTNQGIFQTKPATLVIVTSRISR